jgi:hypothetical protein
MNQQNTFVLFPIMGRARGVLDNFLYLIAFLCNLTQEFFRGVLHGKRREQKSIG